MLFFITEVETLLLLLTAVVTDCCCYWLSIKSRHTGYKT